MQYQEEHLHLWARCVAQAMAMRTLSDNGQLQEFDTGKFQGLVEAFAIMSGQDEEVVHTYALNEAMQRLSQQ